MDNSFAIRLRVARTAALITASGVVATVAALLAPTLAAPAAALVFIGLAVALLVIYTRVKANTATDASASPVDHVASSSQRLPTDSPVGVLDVFRVGF